MLGPAHVGEALVKIYLRRGRAILSVMLAIPPPLIKRIDWIFGKERNTQADRNSREIHAHYDLMFKFVLVFTQRSSASHVLSFPSMSSQASRKIR